MVEVNDSRNAARFLAENREWQSEIGSWEIDLMFCSRMLDIYGLKADTSNHKTEQVDLKKVVSDVIEVRLTSIKRQLKDNERALQKATADELLFKDSQMPYRQDDDRNEMNQARQAVHSLQQRLYGFIELLKSI